jgi:monovalent cation/hydrogen antiporter
MNSASTAISPPPRIERTVVLAAVAAGRVEVLRLHRDGFIHDTVLHTLEHELDLEETAARRHLEEP